MNLHFFFDGKCINPKEANHGYYRDGSNKLHELTEDNSYMRRRILSKFAFMIAPIETPTQRAPSGEISAFVQLVIDNGLSEVLIEGFEKWSNSYYGNPIIEPL